jgi:hypothetical protein
MPSVNDDMPQVDGKGTDEQWRREVASRVDRYRTRRKKKKGDNASLSFDFEPAAGIPAPLTKTVAERLQPGARAGEPSLPPSQATPVYDTNFYRRANAEAVLKADASVETTESDIDGEISDAIDEASAAAYSISTSAAEPAPEISGAENVSSPAAAERCPASGFSPQPAPEYDPDFDFDRPREAEPAVEDKALAGKQDGKLIYFPKPAIRLPVEPPMPAARPYGELAEPISTPPRIVDVPEGIIPTIAGPLFADIRLDSERAHEEPVAAAASTIELPLPVALLSQRLFAGLIDWLVVLAASGVFCAVSWKVLPQLPQGRSALAALAATILFFWTTYHYLMLVYGRKTAGMEMANVSLRCFDGRTPTRGQRQRRVYSMLFSLLSLGLGFAWALVDEDSLCWHDRITRTFPAQDQERH